MGCLQCHCYSRSTSRKHLYLNIHYPIYIIFIDLIIKIFTILEQKKNKQSYLEEELACKYSYHDSWAIISHRLLFELHYLTDHLLTYLPKYHTTNNRNHYIYINILVIHIIINIYIYNH